MVHASDEHSWPPFTGSYTAKVSEAKTRRPSGRTASAWRRRFSPTASGARKVYDCPNAGARVSRSHTIRAPVSGRLVVNWTACCELRATTVMLGEMAPWAAVTLAAD